MFSGIVDKISRRTLAGRRADKKNFLLPEKKILEKSKTITEGILKFKFSKIVTLCQITTKKVPKESEPNALL